jgi:hypothetical protein
MANKTAMQEMLEWVRETFPMDLDTPRMIEAKIESLLKVEKEQIVKAYLEGESDGDHLDNSGENYYSQTYGE